VKRLRNAYGLKQVDTEILEFLFDKCGKIPSKAIPWIEERFGTLYDKFPSKLHAAILACWWDYLREHPQEKAQHAPSACRYCEEGRLLLSKPVELYGNLPTLFIANCAHCKRRQDEPNVPMYTLEEAAALGYQRWQDKEQPRMDYSQQSWWHKLAARSCRWKHVLSQQDTCP